MKKNIRGTLLYFIILFIIIGINYKVWDINSIFIPSNYLNWDAEWYLSIVLEGYSYIGNSTCNLAFFPVFPYLWKFSLLNEVGISIINFFLFVTSLNLLLYKVNNSVTQIIYFLSLPSMFFFAIPYSESIFFVFGTLILIGYRKQNPYLKNIGFLCSSMTRSVSVIFVPAIILTELISKKKDWKGVLLSVVCCVAGTLFSAIVQYSQTGKWFYFLEVQRFWNRTLQFPKFPFTTFSTDLTIGLDTFALLIGVASIIITIIIFWKRLSTFSKHNFSDSNQEMIFCLLFISATTTLDCLFTNLIGNQTNIWSINRHIIASPFGVYLLFLFIKSDKMSDNLKLTIFLVLGVFMIFLTDTHKYMFSLIFYIIAVISLAYFSLSRQESFYKIIIAAILIEFQIIFFSNFLSYKWIG